MRGTRSRPAFVATGALLAAFLAAVAAPAAAAQTQGSSARADVLVPSPCE